MSVLEHQVLLFILLIHVACCIQPSWLPNFRFLQVTDAVYAVNNLRVFKSHNIDVIAIKLKELVHRALNHRILLNDSISIELNRHVNIDNYKVLMMEEVIGSNINDYYIARDALFQFDIINKLPWAKVHISNDLRKYFQNIESSHYNYVGTTKLNLFTLVKCYGLLWSLNPCRIVHNAVIYDQNYHGHRISQLGFATLKGHLIDGDEMFRVMYNYQTSKVVFQLYSITRGR